ncbi:MAG: TIGR03118 family protein [Polyangiaceae bacterium]|nr:TIGR03118 family protein [Polyangiaceae bacterium]
MMIKTNWLVGLVFAGAAAACTSSTGTPDTNVSTGVTSRDAVDGGTEVTPVVQSLVETNIVTSQAPDGGAGTDPNLINAWGLAFNPSGPAWVVANGSGIAQVYNSTGAPALLTVTIPAPVAGDTSAPSGEVFNQDAADFSGDKFLFSTEDGTIVGWQSGTTAALRVDNSGSGAVYKGIAIVNSSELHDARIYATNFHAGTVDVWDAQYAPVQTEGGFEDKHIPSGFAPFNVAVLERDYVLVTYAKQDDMAHDDVKGPGNGFVDVFDLDGRLVTRLISQGALNSPWGLVLPPETFGNLYDTLLVGNFGDGHINAYAIQGLDPDNGDPQANGRNDGKGKNKNKNIEAKFLGAVGDTAGNPLAIDGLWGLQFGAGTGGFSANTLYFTAGPNGESQGIFGSLSLP